MRKEAKEPHIVDSRASLRGGNVNMARSNSECGHSRVEFTKEGEPEEQKTSRLDPSVNSHRPASVKTQDISHMLASIFKDVYTKDIIRRDTLSNLVKSKRGQSSSHHERYVEELQQVHSEYSESIKQADELERHLIKARARAAATEKEAYGKIEEEIGDVQDHQGLFTVQSAFSQCVDSDLLAQCDLISPLDYLPIQKPQVNAPAEIKFHYAKPTISFNMHVSREPQDDGYTVLPAQESKVPERSLSEKSLTLESSSDVPKRMKSPKQVRGHRKADQSKPKPKLKANKPNTLDQLEGLDKLQKLKDRSDFLRNPRFLPPAAHQGGASLIQSKTKAGKAESGRIGTVEQSSTASCVPVFLAKPSVVLFTEYSVGQVYETTLELKNLTSASRHVRVIPPTTTYFAIGLGRFPGDSGIVAPGMSCKYMVHFAPESLGGYEDFITVETQGEDVLVVPIRAERHPPVVTLPRVMECGYCLIGGIKFVEFMCQNVGLSAGKFCILPKDQWPAWNIRSLAKTYFSEKPPFAVSPSLFVLQPGETVVVEVAFFPSTAEKLSQDFTIVCDNCQVKHVSVQGEGQEVALELVSVSGKQEHPMAGEACDLTAEHSIRFSPSNPHSGKEKKMVIRNNTHVELPFHWQIMKPNLRPMPPIETPAPSQIQFRPETDGAFQISPFTGVLAPYKDEEFRLTFRPKELKNHHCVCHLVLSDVPQPPPPPTAPAEHVLPPLHTGSRMSDVIVMEIELKGPMEPYQILLEPYAVVIPGEVYIQTTVRRQFKMWNHSRTFINFQWEENNSDWHWIEVEPSSGRIEENECFDINLLVNGTKPERLVTSLVCRIEYHPEPITVAVEVTFKGPTVTLNVPSVDFGLMKLGTRKRTSLLLTNITQLEASWTLEESQDVEDSQISIEPSRGVLLPSASCSVTVQFWPRSCQQFQTELQLSVENGTGCHLLVRGDVQSPLACLLNCKMLLPDIYVGLPVQGTVTIFNQTMLPTQFKWKPKLQGTQAERCSATFEPVCSTLGPNVQMKITVTFITHFTEATDVIALCEVQGMDSPLVLSIVAPKARSLSVSYSLPDSCPASDDEDPSTLLLDFGDDIIVKRTVSRQLLLANQTAIAAAFTIEPEYFSCRDTDSRSPEQRYAYAARPVHSMHAKKLEEKKNEDLMSRLLANGKGAVFLVTPHAGTLGPLETLTVNVTAYMEMWGKYTDNLLCKVGDLDVMSIPMRMSVTGCPLYFQMLGPSSDGQTQTLNIQFGTQVSGGDTVSRAIRINNPTFMEICMDWETYNVDLDESQPADTDVSFGDLPASDAEREADGKTKPKESSKRKKRRETPDSKESSEFSGSPVDSLSDKKRENETPESSSESVEATSPNDEEKNEAAEAKEMSDSSQSIADMPADMATKNENADTKESNTADTPSSKKAKSGTPDSRKSSASSRGTVGTPSNKKTKAASPDSKGASSSSESTGDTPSTKKMKNQTTDKKSGSSSKSTVDASSNKKAKNGTQDSKKSGTSSKSAVDKKLKNGTPDSRGASTSSESIVGTPPDKKAENETPDSKEIQDTSLNSEEKNETADGRDTSDPSESVLASAEDTSLEKKAISESPDSKESSGSPQSIISMEEEGSVSEDMSKKDDPPSSVDIAPPVGILSDYPYCVTPQQMVIPARGSSTVHVSFTPLTLPEAVGEDRCVGVALGFVRLTETVACVPEKVVRAHGLDLEPIRVDLLAAVKPAALCVQMEEDEQVLEFYASAGDLQREEPDTEMALRDFDIIQTFELRNNLKLPLHFKLETCLPFVVLKPASPRPCTRSSCTPHAEDGPYLSLQPQQRTLVKVAFCCTPALLDHADQAEEEVPDSVTLIQSKRSQRTLQFQQDLLIHYSNNTFQTVPLQACLDLPTISLSTDSIDFGSCYVGKTKTVEVDLHSQGTYTSWTSIIADAAEPCVFRVTPEFGFMKFKNPQSTSWNQTLWISFTPSVDGEFRAVALIKSPLVRTTFTLQLLGKGSFDELYRSNSAT
ncbi:deleted in lung and esophageal cancer protein 1 isoform X2 [Nelusetta ayraudi]|uniref:deleted in lung and esophageal cancer protein 1 isoform X2 n=1 Tax=Nelusetta ayraudi TaxID=303726 RepID=UPI003F6FAE56